MASGSCFLQILLLLIIASQTHHVGALRAYTAFKVTSSGSSPGSLSLYHAPSTYSKDPRPLKSYIITSRPLNFSPRPSIDQDVTGSGVATIVCKGKSCASTFPEDPGFSGEAIPLVDEVSDTKPRPEKTSGSVPVVLDVDRPYLKKPFARTTTTTRRPLRRQRVTPTTTTTSTTTAKPPRSRRPGFGGLFRPWGSGNVYPALAAFTLVALPLAAVAAAPLFVSGRRRRDVAGQEEDMEALLEQLEVWLELDESKYDALGNVGSSEDIGRIAEDAKNAAKIFRPIWSGNIFRKKVPTVDGS